MMDGNGRGWMGVDGEERECHDDGLWVTLVKNGNGTKSQFLLYYDSVLFFR